MAERKALIVRSTEENPGPAWHGELGKNRRAVRPGTSFDGNEGRTQTTTTGWWEPVGWMRLEDLAVALRESEWDGEDSEGMAAEYAAIPEDFPGLAENYPEIVSGF